MAQGGLGDVIVCAEAVLVAARAIVSVWLLAPAMMQLGAGFGLHAGLVGNVGLAVSLFGAIFIPALSTDYPATGLGAITLASTVLALLLAIVSARAMCRTEPVGRSENVAV